MARKIIVYIATSADGFIARKDGSVDWLNRPRTAGDYGMTEFYKSVDTILWGRKTYEVALGFGKKAPWDSRIKNYVFTHHPPSSTDARVEFITDPVETFAPRLREQKSKDIWMMGGGGIIGSFLDASEIDEFIIHVIPTFIGEGIPLIEPRHRNVQLELLTTHAYSDGVVKLHYGVKKSVPRKSAKKQRKTKRT